MKRGIYFLLIFFTLIVVGQETSLNNYSGAWGNNSSWSGGWTDGSPAFLSLPETNADITIFGDIEVGTTAANQNLTFAANKESYDFTVNDTLIVHGDVTFANKAMNLNLGDDAIFIIFGDLEMNNKINIASGGTLVVTGNFHKNGSQGSYSGDGNVYAGSYSGDAQSTIDDGTGEDSSFTIDELSDDGFDEIEEYVNGGGSTPLPVELLYFDASADNSVLLSWATATEINNDYFSIERSEDGVNFYEIGKVNGNGDSNKEITYEFTDKFVLAPVEYYRLKQVDFDGQFEYFQVKRVETNLIKEQVQILAYPTLVQNGKVNLSSTQSFQVQEISIYNLAGGESQNLKQHTIQENPLSYLVDLSNLTKGFYLLRVTTSDGNEFSTRLIVK
ncbi:MULTISPECIES: T9SS type A sorting domain-containing protein [unclassified Ekhidna]|uniref:T9SS type A sorting domain-containing protein n=1 Tax=unclassified Ekhidna TaxID=2632188 RepID=UPI0032DEB2AD